jgi:ribosomal protein S3AE
MRQNRAGKPVAEATKELAKVEMKQNMVAILPIPFLNTETLASSGEMAKMAQNDIYNNLVQNASSIFPLQPQDLRITNNLLKKAKTAIQSLWLYLTLKNRNNGKESKIISCNRCG